MTVRSHFGFLKTWIDERSQQQGEQDTGPGQDICLVLHQGDPAARVWLKKTIKQAFDAVLPSRSGWAHSSTQPSRFSLLRQDDRVGRRIVLARLARHSLALSAHIVVTC
jgi:hypothetical protein